MFRIALALIAPVFLSACSTSPTQPAPGARSELTPTGKLRVGLNLGNFLLVTKDPGGGDPRGIAPDLGRELARRLGVEVVFVTYASPAQVADAAKTNAWDVAFLGAEPARANEIEFTAAYLEIEATYLVPPGSPLRTVADVDKEGVRISVSGRSVYDLYLTRTLKHARLMRVEGLDASWQQFASDKLEALAGLRPRLVEDAARLPGSRVLEGRFQAVQQAIGTPKGRMEAAKYLREFAEDIKASGFVAQAIERNKVRGVNVAARAS